MAIIIDGKGVAASIIADVTESSATLQREKGVQPGLAVVIVGNDPASHAYGNSKSRMAKQCGFHSIQHSLGEETTQGDPEALVGNLNDDPTIHGILVQLPLPTHLNSESVIQLIAPHKDVDGLTVVNAVRLRLGTLKAG